MRVTAVSQFNGIIDPFFAPLKRADRNRKAYLTMNYLSPTNLDQNTIPRRGEGIDPIDAHVGARLKLARLMRGLSQEKLADAVNVTFQQLQKYERGTNRVSASRLYHLAQALDLPVSFFYDDLDGEGEISEAGEITSVRTTLMLMESYNVLPADQRDHLLGLVRSMASMTSKA